MSKDFNDLVWHDGIILEMSFIPGRKDVCGNFEIKLSLPNELMSLCRSKYLLKMVDVRCISINVDACVLRENSDAGNICDAKIYLSEIGIKLFLYLAEGFVCVEGGGLEVIEIQGEI